MNDHYTPVSYGKRGPNAEPTFGSVYRTEKSRYDTIEEDLLRQEAYDLGFTHNTAEAEVNINGFKKHSCRLIMQVLFCRLGFALHVKVCFDVGDLLSFSTSCKLSTEIGTSVRPQ